MTLIQLIEQSDEQASFDTLQLVATGGSHEVIGTCHVTGWKSECPCLMAMWVQPDHRGKGIGMKMIEMVIGRASSAGKRSVTLTVNKANEKAERLYRRLGFRQFSDDEKLRWMALPLD